MANRNRQSHAADPRQRADEAFERSFRKKGNKEIRVNIRTICSEATHFSADRRLFEGTIQNISAGGIYVTADDRPPVGQEVVVAAPFDDDGSDIKRYGKVVWRDESGFAIEFINKGDIKPRR